MEGIRVLEIAEHTFVPAASAVLADWGAEVIKIEHVSRGDAMRGLARTGVMDLGEGGINPLLEHSNRGKHSLALDIATPEGHAIVCRLAAVSDVFLTNKLQHVRTKLAIDIDDIRAHNADIVYVRGSGYGQRGPDVDRGGYDILGYWSRSGVAAATMPADLDRFLNQPGPAYGDSIGAMTIAGGISAALLQRERTGHAPIVDVSLLGTAMWAGGAAIALAAHTGTTWQQWGPGRPDVANPLTQPYRTADGRWLMLASLQGFAYWPEFCRIVQRPELIDDERFATSEALMANSDAAAEILESMFATEPLAYWEQVLAGFRGQWAPVQSYLEVIDDPMTTANGYVADVESAAGRTFQLVTTPVQFDQHPAQPHRAPEFNEQGDEILTGLLAMDWDTVIDLKLRNVVG